jgi:hypothetical protein
MALFDDCGTEDEVKTHLNTLRKNIGYNFENELVAQMRLFEISNNINVGALNAEGNILPASPQSVDSQETILYDYDQQSDISGDDHDIVQVRFIY